MKITKRGLCFSGPSAYISNMAYYEITSFDRSFKSNEQSFQWKKAVDHHDPDLAAEIKSTKDSCDIKSAGVIISTTKEWDDNAPNLLKIMFIKNMEQHLELPDRLIETYPLELIEASSDITYWGSLPFYSSEYDSDKPLPGENIYGKSATRYCNRVIEKMKKS